MNKLIIIGNLTADPELRYTQQNIPVCSMTVAVNDRRGGENAETTFFRATVWRQLGEVCAKYLSKGKKVCLSGPVSVRTYQAKNGETRASIEITAEDVEFLSPRDDAQQSSPKNEATQAPVQQASGYTAVPSEDLPF